MADQFNVPEEYEISFRRILPYLAAPMHRNVRVLESLALYLKFGGEKMARIVIDALNVTQRLQDAEIRKQMREQELLNGYGLGDANGEDDEDDDDNEPDKEDRLDEDAS